MPVAEGICGRSRKTESATKIWMALAIDPKSLSRESVEVAKGRVLTFSIESLLGETGCTGKDSDQESEDSRFHSVGKVTVSADFAIRTAIMMGNS